MKRFLVFALAGLWVAACSPQQFTTRTLDAPSLATHRTVAILPFEVTQDRLRLRDVHYLGTDTSRTSQARIQQQWSAQQLAEAQALAYQLQGLLREQLQEQEPRSGYSVQFQPVAETNRRLQQAGITYATLPERTMSELRQALGVDALLSGQADLYQPLPEGLGLAARLLLNEPLRSGGPGTVVPPSRATTNLTLHDCRTGALTWQFEYVGTGAAALNPTKLATNLVRSSAPSFPYRRR